MIPKCRVWRVRYFMGKTLLAEIDVLTINKMFARWMAGDQLRVDHLDRYLAADRETVSLLKTKEACQ